jgi:formylglycine-generating enzyme required for sulfatase activity
MLKRNLVPVWIGIILMSGMFLMGQETWPPQTQCVDNDQDTYYAIDPVNCPQGDDCHDRNDDIYPNAPERCDGIDNQCPGDVGYGDVDEGCGRPMVEIPTGCFDMGDHFAEGGSDELPVHEVCLSAFWIDAHEVTNAEYAECVAGGGCTPPSNTSSYSRATYYGDPTYDDFPVIWVDWYQAVDYCTWADKRLPTEAEWEYAARGGLAGKRYPWGDTISGADANDWGSGDPWDNDTSHVEYYAANGYGLYDMAGNVEEWVNDWYQSDYYTVSPLWDPPGPATGSKRVLRGGSWNYIPFHSLRVSDRLSDVPDDGFFSFGFRCAR